VLLHAFAQLVECLVIGLLQDMGQRAPSSLVGVAQAGLDRSKARSVQVYLAEAPLGGSQRRLGLTQAGAIKSPGSLAVAIRKHCAQAPAGTFAATAKHGLQLGNGIAHDILIARIRKQAAQVPQFHIGLMVDLVAQSWSHQTQQGASALQALAHLMHGFRRIVGVLQAALGQFELGQTDPTHPPCKRLTELETVGHPYP